jgi:hypothetical protein
MTPQPDRAGSADSRKEYIMSEPDAKDLNGLMAIRVKELRVGHGSFRKLTGSIGGFFRKRPRAEIAHDWMAVNEFAARALIWNLVDRKISLWQSLARRLAAALLAPIVAAGLWVFCAAIQDPGDGAEAGPWDIPRETSGRSCNSLRSRCSACSGARSAPS